MAFPNDETPAAVYRLTAEAMEGIVAALPTKTIVRALRQIELANPAGGRAAVLAALTAREAVAED